MKLEQAQRLWMEFDPVRPLTAEEDHLYVERTDSVTDEFRRQFRFPGRHKLLLMGAVGSGKSTELARLAGQLATRPEAPAVGLLRLQDHVEVQGLAPVHVLLLLTLAALRRVRPDPPRELLERLARAFARVQDPDTRFQESSGAEMLRPLLNGLVVLGGLASAGSGMLDPATTTAAAGALGSAAARVPLPRVQRHLAVNDEPVAELTAVANSAVRWVRDQLQRRQLVLFVDGLDKIPEPQHAQEMFGNGILHGLELSAVLSAPLTLRLDPSEATQSWRALNLGNFRIVKPDGSADAGCVAQMRGIFTRRAMAAGMLPEEAIEGGDRPGGPLDRLVEAGGGLTRDFVLLCRIAVEHAADEEEVDAPLGERHVTAAIAEQRRRYELVLDERRIRLLLESLDQGIRPEAAEADRLLFSNHLLCYFNGAPWYRPHPLVLPYLSEARNRLAPVVTL